MKDEISGIIGEVMYTELWPDRTQFEKHSIISVMMPNISLTTHLLPNITWFLITFYHINDLMIVLQGEKMVHYAN